MLDAILVLLYRGTAGMSGSVEGRLTALPDGPITASRSHQRRGSLPLFRLRENPSGRRGAVDVAVFVASSRTQLGSGRHARQTPSDYLAGPERRRDLQRIDIADRRLAHFETHQRYVYDPFPPSMFSVCLRFLVFYKRRVCDVGGGLLNKPEWPCKSSSSK